MKLELRKSQKLALIDERDKGQARHIWTWHDYLGVVRYDNEHYNASKRRTPHLLLHREITGAPKEHSVIHVNGDKLDNRRANLLVLSRAQSTQYARKSTGKSPYRGVKVTPRNFQAYCGGFLGSFHDEEEAAKVYDVAAWERFGAQAKVNFPRDWEVCVECHKAHFVGQKCTCKGDNR